MQRIRPESGFTLVEMMVALSISVLVVSSVTFAATNFARSYMVAKDLLESQYNMRGASEMLFRDLRTAGYGLHEITNPISDWFPGFTTMVAVDQGTTTSDPDRLRILGAQAVTGGELLFSTTAGATFLTLKSGGSSQFNTGSRNIVVVGRLETARIVSVSGDNITISTDPASAGVGLQYAHPANSPVELVTLTTYECMTTNLTQSGGQPYLARFQNSASAPSSSFLSVAALGIEGFQITEGTNGTYAVDLTGKASRPDKDFLHPDTGDHYRRFELQATMRSIN